MRVEQYISNESTVLSERGFHSVIRTSTSDITVHNVSGHVMVPIGRVRHALSMRNHKELADPLLIQYMQNSL
jgi:hypothetical protein